MSEIRGKSCSANQNTDLLKLKTIWLRELIGMRDICKCTLKVIKIYSDISTVYALTGVCEVECNREHTSNSLQKDLVSWSSVTCWTNCSTERASCSSGRAERKFINVVSREKIYKCCHQQMVFIACILRPAGPAVYNITHTHCSCHVHKGECNYLCNLA